MMAFWSGLRSGHWLRWFFAALLCATGLGKLLDIQGFAQVVASYQSLPDALVLPSAWALTLTELILADLLLLRIQLRWVTRAVALLHLVFLSWLLATLMRGIEIPNCGCFGVFLARPLTWWTPLEDLVLLGLAVWMMRVHR